MESVCTRCANQAAVKAVKHLRATMLKKIPAAESVQTRRRSNRSMLQLQFQFALRLLVVFRIKVECLRVREDHITRRQGRQLLLWSDL
jgi:hypothetical protein